MASYRFSIPKALQTGWELTKKHRNLIAQIWLVTILIYIVDQLIFDSLGDVITVVTVLVGIIFFIIEMTISIGTVKIALQLFDKKKAALPDLFTSWPLIFPVVVSGILYSLIVGLGLILLIVPGIYFALRYQFYMYNVIDKHMGPLAALKDSWTMTAGQEWQLLGYALAAIGLFILGLIPFGLGILIVSPVLALAGAYIYRSLAAK